MKRIIALVWVLAAVNAWGQGQFPALLLFDSAGNPFPTGSGTPLPSAVGIPGFLCYTSITNPPTPCVFSGGGGGGGTVTSVTFTGDGTILSSTPSAAVTTSGTLTATLLTQVANCVLAGPATGAAANPTCRALVVADIPAAIPIASVGSAGLSATSPVSIASTGAIACATCVVASSPGVGIAHFAGSTQTVTSSAVNLTAAADVTGSLPAANIVTGTSGAAIPLLNGTNTWSGAQTFNISTANGNGGNFSLQANNVATAIACKNPGILSLVGNYWTGAASANNTMAFTPSCVAGTNGAETLTISNTAGSTGKFTVVVGSKAGDQLTSVSYGTATNCSNSASPAVCGSAAAGSVAIPTGTNPTLVVNTTAVTAASQILLTTDDSITIAATTCNSTLATLVGGVAITARTAGTSFTISFNGVVTTNPVCLSYTIVN